MENKQNVPERQKNKKSSSGLILIIIIVVLILLIIAFGAAGIYFWQKNFSKETKPATEEEEKEEVLTEEEADAIPSRFAEYKEVEIDITPNVKPYTVKSDLSNIANLSKFELKKAAKSKLSKNAFVVQPGDAKEFFQLYEANRYDNIPSFITTDSVLHTYHLVFSLSLKQLEKGVLIPELKNLNNLMLQDALKQYKALKGTEWENAAKRNVAFFAVGSKLLDDGTEIPDIVKSEVEEELELIKNHSGMEASPVMNMGQDNENNFPVPAENSQDLLLEDYSQYIPRGHYTKSDSFKNYFKAMMWYGRLTFRLKNEDEVKSAILITNSLSDNDNLESWDKIYEPINFFVGKSDDITYYDFIELVESTYGKNPELNEYENTDKLDEFINSAKNLEPPQINSMPIFDARIEENREEQIMGFRFMGQRFTIDASVFQRLVYREVGDKTHTCEDGPDTWIPGQSRRLPKGMDIPAAFGSEEALDILNGEDDTSYACYSENMENMKEYIDGLEMDTWTQNLYWGWLYNLRPLLVADRDGYPSFMNNDAWTRKNLNTFLGSWTELKHDTILYAKQVYAELGGLFDEKPEGYVEPDPEVYGRLISLTNMTKDGLNERNILTDNVEKNLNSMEELAEKLLSISKKELEEKQLSEEDYDLIRYYGGDLEQFWIEAYKDEGVESAAQINDHPAALIADVATDPDQGKVLEEGIGNIFEILAVVPIEGKLVLAKGGVFSQYEFQHPIDDRLTDEKWREMLEAGNEPSLPSWQNSYIVR